jgi:hypothetical protein
MDAKMLLLLQSADDPEHCEQPWEFDRRAAMSRVELVIPELERIIGRPLELDTAVQDASFFTEIWLRRPAAKAGYIDVLIAVRFSAFADLFTVWTSCPDEPLPEALVQRVVAAVEEFGFRFVDEDSLAEPYSGANEAFVGETWWYRFFEYL